MKLFGSKIIDISHATYVSTYNFNTYIYIYIATLNIHIFERIATATLRARLDGGSRRYLVFWLIRCELGGSIFMHSAAISRLELFTNSRHLRGFSQVGHFAAITTVASWRELREWDREGECNCNGELITRDIIAFPGSKLRGADISVRKLRRGDFALRRPTPSLFPLPSSFPLPRTFRYIFDLSGKLPPQGKGHVR